MQCDKCSFCEDCENSFTQYIEEAKACFLQNVLPD